MKTIFTSTDLENYNRDGYLIKREFFSKEEAGKIYETALNDKVLRKKSLDLNDKEGLKTRLTLWYDIGNDIYGSLTRSQRMVTTVGMLVGGTPAHYHSKLMQKEPKVGGAWEWHQDYGYWYEEGFLYPQMLSVMVALTEANKNNGCLQVLKGSHKLGRLNHDSMGGQVEINAKKIEGAKKYHQLEFVELQPGDTLFFHCNLLHRSDANLSDNSRWSLISAYNLASNVPYGLYIDKAKSSIKPVEILPDESILSGRFNTIDENVEFLSNKMIDDLHDEIKS